MDAFLPPRAETKPPALKVPPLSCDCHMHIFGPAAQFPYTPQRSFTPHDALIVPYLRMAETLGLERRVVVQASVYGSDNRRTVTAVEEFGLDRTRGIVMVEAEVDRATLRDLDSRGIVGTRFITTVKGGPSLEHLPGVAHQIADFGWHIEMYVPRHLWPELLPLIKALPVPIVFCHMGGLSADTDRNDRDLCAMLALMAAGRCWVKLCGYRASVTGHPYADVAPLARRFIETAPERCVWGSDWPHTTLTGYMPDDGDLLDLLGDWAPDEATRARILVHNPTVLYRFA